MFEPKAGLFPKLKVDPGLLLAAPNPALALLPNRPLLAPKPVLVVVLPKRLGAEDVLVLPKPDLFCPKRDVEVLLVEPKPPMKE